MESPAKLKEKMLNFIVNTVKTACFVERKSYSAGKRRIFHNVIVHFSGIRGKGDEAR